MPTLRDVAVEFARQGGTRAVTLDVKHLGDFLDALLEAGVRLARGFLRHIDDPNLRKIVEAVLLTASSGAILGAAVGGFAAGPQGAGVGAVVGAVAGAVVGIVGVYLSIDWIDGPSDRPGGRRVRIAAAGLRAPRRNVKVDSFTSAQLSLSTEHYR